MIYHIYDLWAPYIFCRIGKRIFIIHFHACFAANYWNKYYKHCIYMVYKQHFKYADDYQQINILEINGLKKCSMFSPVPLQNLCSFCWKYVLNIWMGGLWLQRYAAFRLGPSFLKHPLLESSMKCKRMEPSLCCSLKGKISLINVACSAEARYVLS